MKSSIDSPADLGRTAREIVTRSVAAVGLAGIALIHLLDSLGKFQETPYMGWMYVGLMVSSLAVAATLVHTHSREAWLATHRAARVGDRGLRAHAHHRPAAGQAATSATGASRSASPRCSSRAP